MAINYNKCPTCGSKDTIKIVYGMPSYELFQEAEAGKVKLGGCEILESNPEYFCNYCEHKWNREQAIDAAYGQIKGLNVSAGGYFGGYYNVDVDLITRSITWSHWVGGKEEVVHKTIRESTTSKFIEQIKMINLLNWKARYLDSGVCDGTQWSIEIITEGRNIKKRGDNMFPVEWDKFRQLIKKITGKEFR